MASDNPARYAAIAFNSATKIPGFFFWVCALILLLVSTPVQAHRFNESYVYFDVTEDNLSGRVEITVRDLARIHQGSAEVKDSMTQEDVLRLQDSFFEYFDDRMKLYSNGQPLRVQFDNISFFNTSVGNFAQLHFNVQGIEKTPTTIDMSYDGLQSDIDPTHRGFALIATNTRNGMGDNESYISLVFSPGDGVKSLYLNDEPTRRIARGFFEYGVWHIWHGFDHILFLVTLLLGAVMRVENQRLVPSESIGESLWQTVKIVTVFTVAHTIALGLATFGIITLPVTLVEAVIALSIAAVAIGNLVPRFHSTLWLVVVLFGAFHGFGFATVLEPLGLDPERKLLGLVTFNIGIEIGQLAVVMLLFPVFFVLRRLTVYRVVGLQLGSIALIALAMFWFYERTIGFSFIGETLALVTE